MPTGTPDIKSDPSGNHDFIFSWDGSIAANQFQATQGLQDMVAQQKKSGTIDNSSSVSISGNNVVLTIVVNVAFITATVHCNGTLTPSADGTSTNFSLVNGTVDADDFASASQVHDQLVKQVTAWEQQAQKEPLQAPAAGSTGLDL